MHDVSEIECHARGPWMETGGRKREDATQKRDGGKTGGSEVLGGNGDKDGKRELRRGGISTQTEIIGNAIAARSLHRCTLSAQAAATTTHARTHARLEGLLGAAGGVSQRIHSAAPQHKQRDCAAGAALTC